jgi:hypothetical protein
MSSVVEVNQARPSELHRGMSGLSRKLKIDSRFTPCSAEDGDELFPNGIFVFNITKMTEYIMHSQIPSEEVQIRDFSREASKFKEEHLAAVDITRPIIVAEISPGRYNVIDGNHRIEKARRLGMETIRAYRLGPEQHMQFLTTGQGYSAYVEYWNGKLKDEKQATERLKRHE